MTYTDETFYQAVRGNERAIEATIKQFTPLVHKWVRKYKFMGQEYNYQDFVQEGLIGVLNAIRTFDETITFNNKPIRPMTWVWWKVRGAVQVAARREQKHPKYNLAIEDSDWGNNLEDTVIFELKDDKLPLSVEEILKAGCGDLDSRRANIVKDRFGLLGHTEMRQGEVAKKYGLTKQATNGHIARFSKTVREKHPELKEYI